MKPAVPMGCSLTAPAARISSAARKPCWRISRAGCRRFGLVARLAIADTAGAAWALARYGREPTTILPPGAAPTALAPLPVAALRLSQGSRSLMRRLGLRRIGDVMEQPRAPFGARFESEYLLRLDQALGRAPEPLVPVMPPPVYRAQADFLEPIFSEEHVLVAARRLAERCLPNQLAVTMPARACCACCCSGSMAAWPRSMLALAAASRDPQHILRLIALRLERLGEHARGRVSASKRPPCMCVVRSR